MTTRAGVADRLERAAVLIEIVQGAVATQRPGVVEAARRRRLAMSLLETTALPAAMCGRSGEIELANPAWRALFGGDRLDPQLVPQVASVLRSKESVHVPELAIDPEHRLAYVAATVRASRGRLGAATGAIVVCELITDVVVARQLDIDVDVMVWAGHLGVEADYYNAAWHRRVGQAPWKNVVDDDDRERCLRALTRLSVGRREVAGEMQLRCGTELLWHRVTVEAVGSRWFFAAADVHAQRTSSEERAELLARAVAAREEAELANRRKDQFLAAVSHELRAPVTTMMLWDKVLRDETADAPLRAQALDAIHDSAVAQARLVGDLLDISRAISGKLHVDLRSIDAARIVAEALSGVATAAAARGIAIVPPAGAGTTLVHGDAFRVRQILDNLLSNAVKFTERGGTITVEITSKQRFITISVTDSGRGIAADFLERIFEPFSQSEDAFTRSGAGLGLGLAISKQLVELQGGALTATSPGLGQGSKFSVSLPSAGRASSPVVAPHTPSLPHRIVLVDDDRRVLEALSLLLERTGAKVVTAESAELARLAIAETSPDVVLCDIAMPREDGYTFVTKLRASGVRVPSIALTAHAMEADATRALAAGFDAHVAKPIDFERLVAKIAQLIASRAESS